MLVKQREFILQESFCLEHHLPMSYWMVPEQAYEVDVLKDNPQEYGRACPACYIRVALTIWEVYYNTTYNLFSGAVTIPPSYNIPVTTAIVWSPNWYVK